MPEVKSKYPIRWGLNLSCDPAAQSWWGRDDGKLHERCVGVSQGTSSDPVTYACTCACHGWEQDKERKEP